MNTDEARAEVRRILAADLADLVGDGRSLLPPVGRDDWALPRQDKDLLWRHGLPGPRDDGRYGISADYQRGKEPELEREGSAYYRVGVYAGVPHLAERGTGRVVHPVPARAEVHPQLAAHFPDTGTLAPVDSSVASWVELAWRWHRLVPVLAEQWARAGEAEVEALRAATGPQPPPDFYAGVRELGHEVLTAFRARDPAAITSKKTFWWGVVLDL
ncbi:hypothetical protein GCM10022224_052730 [Nonomuraea antimicrobica]|uniref:Uncharacterized protein n=1 Tax=Nonomuraea antimicrobica TaxID=561173 RepID=A0ABP7C7F7_9ACTN